MAGDWIKMRVDLYRDPKVIVMADFLMDIESDLSAHINQHTQRDRNVTRNVMRNVTVGALVAVWGVGRTQGKRIDDDLLIPKVTISVIDDICDLPGFGAAMESVGWVVQTEKGVVFPKFFEEHNADYDEQKQKNRERQRRYRERQKSNVTVTLRNAPEKRREEKNIFPPKSPQGGSSRRELRKKAGASFEELMQVWRAHSGEAQYEPAKFWSRLPEATKAATRACGGFSWLSSVGATNRSSEKKKFIQAILEPQGA